MVVVIRLSELLAILAILIILGLMLWEIVQKEINKSRFKKVTKEVDKYLEELYIELNGSLKEMLKNKPSKYTNLEWRQLVETYVQKLDREQETEDFWK
jgi:hypothetical protein